MFLSFNYKSLTITDKKISRLSFLPVLINTKAKPVVVSPGDSRFEEALKNMEDLCTAGDLDTKLHIEGSEIVVGLDETQEMREVEYAEPLSRGVQQVNINNCLMARRYVSLFAVWNG